MFITGTVYLVDSLKPNIQTLIDAVARHAPPPTSALADAHDTLWIIDMDETDPRLEVTFPQYCHKVLELLPTMSTICKEIDGHVQEAQQEYIQYLIGTPEVQQFLAVLLGYLHHGGDVIMYSPAIIEDGALWLNTLIWYFQANFGITLGLPRREYGYDPRADAPNALFCYGYGRINITDFMNNYMDPNPPEWVHGMICKDLLPYCLDGKNPMDLYRSLVTRAIESRTPILPLAVR